MPVAMTGVAARLWRSRSESRRWKWRKTKIPGPGNRQKRRKKRPGWGMEGLSIIGAEPLSTNIYKRSKLSFLRRRERERTKSQNVTDQWLFEVGIPSFGFQSHCARLQVVCTLLVFSCMSWQTYSASNVQQGLAKIRNSVFEEPRHHKMTFHSKEEM